MTNRASRHAHAGFTLIELVIVLGITGLIFSGLWGLLTSGSTQLQAQAAAQQYRQVIDATRKYATSGVYDGEAPGAIVTPTVGDLRTAGLLPDTFSDKDAYGNNILIKVETIDATKQQWRFVVYSDLTTTIIDKVGAQISSLIGSEGGFVYNSATDGCAGTANATACGSFNSFTLPLADFAIANGSGRIVNLGYTVDTNSGTAPWLYRKAAITPEQNTMQQNMLFNNGLSLSMQGSTIVMGGGSLSMGNAAAATTGGGTLYMGAGTIADTASFTGGNMSMTFSNVTQTFSNLIVNMANGITYRMQGTSSIVITPDDPNLIVLDIGGIGRATEFQAQKFIYSSDMNMKENLRPITDALQKVLLLHGFNYKWKGTQSHDVGLMAQDVAKVFPELVSTSPNGSLGVDYPKIIAPMVEAIRELKLQNDMLKSKVDSLEQQIKATHQ